MLHYTATPVSPGLVVGPCLLLRHRVDVRHAMLQDTLAEQQALRAGCVTAQRQLDALIRRAENSEQKDMLAFQRALLEDPAFLEYVEDAIAHQRGALGAVQDALLHFAAMMRGMEDDYFSARGADIEDVGHRLCGILSGGEASRLRLEHPVVLVATDLYPSDLIGVDRRQLLGIIVSGGSPQSHAAIIARTMGIPALILAGTAFLDNVSDGVQIALDGSRGEFFLWPDGAVLARFHHQQLLERRRRLSRESMRSRPCVTRDGTRVRLLANCGNPEDICYALRAGAEGVGLLRSEFLFIDDHLPDEEEQLDFYRSCVASCNGAPLTIRTIDLGADKHFAGLTAENEENPALGLRGVRLALAYENLLVTQLRALLRAAAEGPLRVMLPMITTPADFERVRVVFDRVRVSLRAEGLPFDSDMELGVMVETPSAAVLSDQLAQQAAFFSIGTNDLTQYMMAADRTNVAVESYYRPDSEAVERMVHLTLQNARKAGISCSICGESAAIPEMACRYVRQGARSLSMAAPSIAEIKETLCALNLQE